MNPEFRSKVDESWLKPVKTLRTTDCPTTVRLLKSILTISIAVRQMAYLTMYFANEKT